MDTPFVSCIMPTAGRHHFVKQAVFYFLRQDYPRRELVIVEDGDGSVAELLPSDTRIRLIRLDARRTVGAKRNIACELARGEVILHWDDDDWSAPWRVRYQVEALLEHDAHLSGLSAVRYLEPGTGRCWQYMHPRGPLIRPWVAGNTFCYPHTQWARHPFPDLDVGEDQAFLRAISPQAIVMLPDPSFFIATIHPQNVSPKRMVGPRWHPLPDASLDPLLGDDLEFYLQFRRTIHSQTDVG